MTYFHSNSTAIFLGSQGGNGHNAAREALLKRYLEAKNIPWTDFQKNPSYYGVKSLDMMDDILNTVAFPTFGKLGDFSKNSWNKSQESGDLKTQKNIIALQPISEILFSSTVYKEIKRHLLELETEPEVFISTQALCTDAIAKAIRDVNHIRGWHVKLDLWMTDLPTRFSTHFFNSLKYAKNYKDIITLHAPQPLLSKSEISPKEFWSKFVDGIHVVEEENFPIRKKFLEQPSLLGQKVTLKLKIHSEAEYEKMKSGLNTQDIANICHKDEFIKLPIAEHDRVATLMLGSKPSKPAVLSYLSTIIKVAKEREKSSLPGKLYFFIFSGQPDNKNYENALLKEISQILTETDIPDHLNIIPFTFQNDDELAPLLARSDITITRPGGLTTMELLHLNRDQKGCVLLHAEGILPHLEKHPLKKNLEQIAIYIIFLFYEIRYKLIGKKKGALIKNAEIKKALINKISEKFPNYSNLKLESIIDDPLESYSSLIPLLQEIYYDPLFEEDKLIQKTISQFKKKMGIEDKEILNKAIQKLLIQLGMAGWEAGNAKYCKKKLNAKIISPLYCEDIFQDVLFPQSNSQS